MLPSMDTLVFCFPFFVFPSIFIPLLNSPCMCTFIFSIPSSSHLQIFYVLSLLPFLQVLRFPPPPLFPSPHLNSLNSAFADIIKLLLASTKKIDTNLENRMAHTPLIIATAKGNATLLNILLSAKSTDPSMFFPPNSIYFEEVYLIIDKFNSVFVQKVWYIFYLLTAIFDFSSIVLLLYLLYFIIILTLIWTWQILEAKSHHCSLPSTIQIANAWNYC